MPRDENIAGGAPEFLERIPQEIRGTFTDQQIAAINQAFQPARHGINMRVSLPLLPWGRRYFVLLSGKERRSQERRRLERLLTPLLTVPNVVAMAIIGFLFVFFLFNFLHVYYELFPIGLR